MRKNAAFIRGRRLIIFLLVPAALFRGRRLFRSPYTSENFHIKALQYMLYLCNIDKHVQGFPPNYYDVKLRLILDSIFDTFLSNVLTAICPPPSPR